MGIIETDETGLPYLIAAHRKVLVMFWAEHSAACGQIRPIFELFSTNQAYAGITFLGIRASESDAVKQSLEQQTVPFFVSYLCGGLLHGDMLHTEQQLRGILHALHQHPE